jgi:hypothetical protein
LTYPSEKYEFVSLKNKNCSKPPTRNGHGGQFNNPGSPKGDVKGFHSPRLLPKFASDADLTKVLPQLEFRHIFFALGSPEREPGGAPNNIQEGSISNQFETPRIGVNQ